MEHCTILHSMSPSGVRRGGFLSPTLFNGGPICRYVYHIACNNGCYLNRFCVACIMYAGDLVLISASVSSLQQLLPQLLENYI